MCHRSQKLRKWPLCIPFSFVKLISCYFKYPMAPFHPSSTQHVRGSELPPNPSATITTTFALCRASVVSLPLHRRRHRHHHHHQQQQQQQQQNQMPPTQPQRVRQITAGSARRRRRRRRRRRQRRRRQRRRRRRRWMWLAHRAFQRV